jgi:toxin YoeB
MEKNWHNAAWDDYLFWYRSHDKNAIKRIHTLLKDIERHPFEGIGKPEPLKHGLAGCWSRRIDDENRIVYEIIENRIEILRCRGHYA